MKKFKKNLRFAVLIFLICLATLGVGICGAAVVLPKRGEGVAENEIKIELVETQNDQAEGKEMDEQVKN